MLKEIKLMEDLLKYVQSQVYMPQKKVRLLVLKEHNSPKPDYTRERPP